MRLFPQKSAKSESNYLKPVWKTLRRQGRGQKTNKKKQSHFGWKKKKSGNMLADRKEGKG